MHIEPGFVAPAKVMLANVGAVAVIAWGAKEQVLNILREPWAPVKTVMAALFFSVFMQSFHMPAGPSELHFVGAMAMYLTFGFHATLVGFGLGLLCQGLLFEPGDLVHLGVNSLSLIVPLIAVHFADGRRLFGRERAERLSLLRIVRLDGLYYAGVTAMVGFWLMIGETETAFADWLTFAASYLIIVMLEPVITFAVVRGLKAVETHWLVSRLFAVSQLNLAR